MQETQKAGGDAREVGMEQNDSIEKKLAEIERRENDPSFWLHDAHLRMRANVEALVAEMKRLSPDQLGQLPAIAHELLWVLDDLTKLTKRGFSMQPPSGPPVAPPGTGPDNEPMDERIKALEAFAHDARERLARIETKLDGLSSIFATKGELQKELHALTWKIIGACTVLAGAVFWIAKNVH